MRRSNIELLRILSMVLIVIHHFSFHGPWGTGLLSSNIVIGLLSFGGKLGVDVFVIISGYFLIKSRFKIMSLVKIVLEVWIYSWTILLLFALLQPDAITKEGIIKALFPIISSEYWFMTNYVFVVALSPFLNLLWQAASRKMRRRLVCGGFIFLSIVPTLVKFNPLGANFVWFVFLYYLGAAVRSFTDGEWQGGGGIFDPLFLCRKIGGFPSALISIVFALVSVAAICCASWYFGFAFWWPRFFTEQYTIPMVWAAVGLFVGFNNLKIGSVPAVNFVAHTTLGVYLIHDNPFVRGLLWPHFAFLYESGWLWLLVCGVGTAIAIFCVCSVIDACRIVLLEKPLLTFISSKFESRIKRFDAWFNDSLRGEA